MTAPRDDIAGQETTTVHDPFLGKNVEVSSKLTDRLRGKYAKGPTMPDGEPEFGWSQFETPPIQHEAADAIDALQARVKELERDAEAFERPEQTLRDNGIASHSEAVVRVVDAESRALRAEQERDEAYERAAKECDEMGAREQESYGLTRAAQNYFRARNAIRRLASGPEKEKS